MGRAIDGNWVKFVGNLSESVAAKFREGKADFRELLNAIEDQPTLPQPSNEALTLEELRGMDGVNALWVHDLAWGLHKPRLMLVHGITEDWWTCCDFNGFETFNADDYGDRYLLYRRPPEGEEEPDGH